MSPLSEDHNLHNLIKSATCFKSSKGRCIDLILTNRKHSFMHSKSFETGFSDHHHMIYTILKSTFEKVYPTKITYRDYKTWSQEKFENELSSNMLSSLPTEYKHFEKIFTNTLDGNAPQKTKIVRANNKPHMNKELRKAIMRRSQLKNIANKTNKKEDIKRYREQRNVVVRMNKNAKREYYRSIQAKSIENDKKFWKTIKPLFSNVNPMSEKINLIENGKILSNDEEIAECFNEYFINITDEMDIDPSLKENIPENMTPAQLVVRAVNKTKGNSRNDHGTGGMTKERARNKRHQQPNNVRMRKWMRAILRGGHSFATMENTRAILQDMKNMLSAAPLGPLSIYMQNVVSLKVRHLANTIIVNTHDDLWKVREALKESSLCDWDGRPDFSSGARVDPEEVASEIESDDEVPIPLPLKKTASKKTAEKKPAAEKPSKKKKNGIPLV
eukprot:gene18339-20183_t